MQDRQSPRGTAIRSIAGWIALFCILVLVVPVAGWTSPSPGPTDLAQTTLDKVGGPAVMVADCPTSHSDHPVGAAWHGCDGGDCGACVALPVVSPLAVIKPSTDRVPDGCNPLGVVDQPSHDPPIHSSI